MSYKSMNFSGGLILEYRFYRLFLARGLFAERSLKPAVGTSYEKCATDIDVLATDYGTGFHATRLNVECKSGDNLKKLDRIIWQAGIQRLLKSEVSYLVVPEVDADIAAFGKSLKVFTVTPLQLESWEKALKLNDAIWLGRSDYSLYEPAQKRWREIQKQEKGKDVDWLLFKDVTRFLTYDSWLEFSFANLNRLLRLAEEIAYVFNNVDKSSEKASCARFSMGALFVRFCQLLIELCEQSLAIPPSQLHEYIGSKLVFGDNDSRNAKKLIEGTIAWVGAGLNMKGQTLPKELDPSRLVAPPKYTKEFMSLIELVLSRPAEACTLPLSAELLIFDSKDKIKEWPEELLKSFEKGTPLALQAKGFFLRASSGVAELLEGVPEALLQQAEKAPHTEIVDQKGPSSIPILEARRSPESLNTHSESKIITSTLELSIFLLGFRGWLLSINSRSSSQHYILSAEQLASISKLLGLPSFTDEFKCTLSDEQSSKLTNAKLEPLSDVEVDRALEGWIEWQLNSLAKTKDLTLKSIEWKRVGDANEFIANFSDSRKIVEVSKRQFQDLVRNKKARSAFKHRLEDTVALTKKR